MGVAEVVIGASDHYGRAELVTLGREAGAPVLLDRRRVALIGDGLPVAPYHHEALDLDLATATALVARVRRSVAEHAEAAISAMRTAFRAEVLILPASPAGRPPDTLAAVLRSRRLTNAADGMLYRESLAAAAADAGLEVRRFLRRADPTLLAAEAMGMDIAAVRSLLARFGREAGPPWRADEKRAAAAALSVLGAPAPHPGRLRAPVRSGSVPSASG